VPDHLKIAVKEFRSAIRHLNEALTKLKNASIHFFYANEFNAQKEVCEARDRLSKDVISVLIKSLEKIIGPQNGN
jgi:hypothetical protein